MSTSRTTHASSTSGSTDTHCKITATERGVLLSLKKLFPKTVNCLNGKIGKLLFVATPCNKMNLDIDNHVHLFKQLQHLEMMYAVKFRVAVCTVSEMEHATGIKSLNQDYFGPLGDDDYDTKTYRFITTSTKAMAPDTFV